MSVTAVTEYELFEERSQTLLRSTSLDGLITSLRQHFQRLSLGALDYQTARAVVCLSYPGECETLPLPLVESAKSFLDSMKRWNLQGRPLASDEEVKRRESICAACVNLRGWRELGVVWCGICRCGVGGKVSLKLRMESEKCPVNFW